MALAEIAPDGSVEGVRFVEHTADAVIEVEACSLDACLARAGAGLFASMFAPPPAAAQERVLELTVEAEDTEGLMVAWLQELLYRSEVDGICFRRLEVGTEGRRLRARAAAVPFGAGVEAVGPLVKAVTRHELRVHEVDGRWRARVLVDV